MPLAIYTSAAWTANGGIEPAGGASVEVRDENTGNLVSLFSDRAGATGLDNPFTADAPGRCAFFVAGGSDRVKVTSGANEHTLNWQAVGTAQEFDASALAQQVGSVADLRAATFPASLQRLWLSGYYGVGTAGGGSLYRDDADATTADNGGTVLVDADGVRWKRNVGSTLSVSDFGAIGDGTTDDRGALQDLFDAVQDAGGSKVYFPPGEYLVTGTVQVGDVEIDGRNATLVVDTENYAFNVDQDCDHFLLKGMKFNWLGQDEEPGAIAARALRVSVDSIRSVQLWDCSLGVGRVRISLDSPKSGDSVVVRQNSWFSTEEAHGEAAALQINIGDGMPDVDERRYRYRGVFVENNDFDVWGQSDFNYNLLKVSAKTFRVRVQGNSFINNNPDSEADIDIYWGGDHGTIHDNYLNNVFVETKSHGGNATTVQNEMVSVTENTMEFDEDFGGDGGNYAVTARHPFTLVRGNRVRKYWPDGVCNRNFFAFWLREHETEDRFGLQGVHRSIYSENIIEIDYDTNPDDHEVIAFRPSGQIVRLCNITNNFVNGGQAIIGGVEGPGNGVLDSVVALNNWVPSFDAPEINQVSRGGCVVGLNVVTGNSSLPVFDTGFGTDESTGVGAIEVEVSESGYTIDTPERLSNVLKLAGDGSLEGIRKPAFGVSLTLVAGADSSVTVRNNQRTDDTNILLEGSSDFAMSPGDVLFLFHNGKTWVETGKYQD